MFQLCVVMDMRPLAVNSEKWFAELAELAIPVGLIDW